MDAITLSEFEYRLCTSTSKKNRPVSFHLPDMVVNINFEKGYMILEGNWEFLVRSNEHNTGKWFNMHPNRVTVETKFTSATPLKLCEGNAAGMVFPLEGYLNDGLQTAGAEGLLIVNKEKDSNWHADIFLFDYQFDVCEIHFNIPLYISPGKNERAN